jgi:methionine sulfoxide reductase heme-binding subunit
MKWQNKLFRLALLIPLFWWVYQIFWGDLGAEPAKELNHSTGLVALSYLVANLWIGIIWSFWKAWPTQMRFLLPERRFLGVWTFVILCGHVFLYFALEAFEAKAFTQIFEKTYLIVAIFAFLGMAILAATSNNFSIRKLGGKKWKLLHRCVYFVAVLVTIHIFLIEKADLILFTWITLPMWLGQFARLLRYLISRRQIKA